MWVRQPSGPSGVYLTCLMIGRRVVKGAALSLSAIIPQRVNLYTFLLQRSEVVCLRSSSFRGALTFMG